LPSRRTSDRATRLPAGAAPPPGRAEQRGRDPQLASAPAAKALRALGLRLKSGQHRAAVLVLNPKQRPGHRHGSMTPGPMNVNRPPRAGGTTDWFPADASPSSPQWFPPSGVSSSGCQHSGSLIAGHAWPSPITSPWPLAMWPCSAAWHQRRLTAAALLARQGLSVELWRATCRAGGFLRRHLPAGGLHHLMGGRTQVGWGWSRAGIH